MTDLLSFRCYIAFEEFFTDLLRAEVLGEIFKVSAKYSNLAIQERLVKKKRIDENIKLGIAYICTIE